MNVKICLLAFCVLAGTLFPVLSINAQPDRFSRLSSEEHESLSLRERAALKVLAAEDNTLLVQSPGEYSGNTGTVMGSPSK